MKNDLISVIIPSFNRKELINKAIESVLKQTYKNVEIIIIDDGSTDGTEKYLKEKYKNNEIIAFYKNEKNSGAGFSRKVGYKKSNGNYIIFMDDDDYYTNFDFFNQAIEILDNNHNISFVSSSSIIEYVKEKRTEESIMNIKGYIKNSEYLSEFQQKYMKSNSTFTTIFRKECLENANFNDVEMVNDSTIYLRALLTGDAYILDTISGVYRVHSKNITFSLKMDFIIDNLIEKKKVYDEILKRKIINNPDEWLKKQVLLTTVYFINNNKISDEEFDKLVRWCKENCGETSNEIIYNLIKLKKE